MSHINHVALVYTYIHIALLETWYAYTTKQIDEYTLNCLRKPK